ncbi:MULTISPECIES: hypothetical protein [unclassified Acinetobacter]|uniref:hypothetical protein n=1 Tax=unclassified Acinetobacter TaxID=196816 RepID=UPI002934C291|nr:MULTISPECIES: hypothetical protein [unclassified Acinetobacter]WOE31522.1 hypothetical protein QSG84_14640 [Acinetobacter sp. SAAs470]WOE39718.1 hypothetical protein QSG86_08305 [Acinetobacter sp. SAAs474]
MFITAQLNKIRALVEQQGISSQLQKMFEQRYVNLEAMLLRAKVLREFSTSKVQYIAQSSIQSKHANLAFLFAPFILANLNHTVIYHTPATSAVIDILGRYYPAEKKQYIKIDQVLSALNLYLDLNDDALEEIDFFYYSLIVALSRADVSQIFLVTDIQLNRAVITEIEAFFKVVIRYIQTDPHDQIMEVTNLNMRQLLFKTKDDQYTALCEKFSKLNGQLLMCYGVYNHQQAKHLVDDMFYAEHIYEKLSVYAEYMQTRLQHEMS